jgi:hypothetical protein
MFRRQQQVGPFFPPSLPPPVSNYFELGSESKAAGGTAEKHDMPEMSWCRSLDLRV